MTHTVRHAIQVATTTMLLLGVAAPAAIAGPAPLEPEFPPPEQSPTVVTEDVSFATQLGWMLTGAGVVLAITAIALIAVLWHRAHAGSHRLATR